jgi:hypothetical protein
MHRNLMAATAFAFGALVLPVSAFAEFDGGGSGGAAGSDGDWAVNDELKNPRLIEPGSRYGYDRTYARGPAPWPHPPAYQALERAPRRQLAR